MYLDLKTKSVTLVKLVKSKFKIFHTRVCRLVVTLNISATTEPVWKQILQVDHYASFYINKMVNWPFTRDWV